MVQKIAWVFGGVFAAIGVLGFVPGITSGGNLLGIFEVDALHNVIHLVTGLVFLAVAWKYNEHAKISFKVFGVIYALVAVLGFIQGSTVLGLIGVNLADNLLHIVVAGVALYAGFMMKDGMSSGGMSSNVGGDHDMGSDSAQQGM
jgi:hypothetical protein